jgi:hypothetical protein
MTLNERILDFLDGSLPADDEAELLHRLSVSPEKRGVLRGFMEQRALLTRDAKSLPVPYAAEQRLWARMDYALPMPVAEEAPVALVPVEAPNAGFFARAFSGASATMGAFTLVAGIGIGYFAGHAQPAAVATSKVATQAASPISKTDDLAISHVSYETNGSYKSNGAHVISSQTGLPLPAVLPPPPGITEPNPPTITPVAEAIVPAITLADIGGDGVGIKPMFHQVRSTRETNPSFLSRFEFRIDESFGRQFPNSVATNVSLPIITNSSITTFFQIFPHSNLLWVGASFGSANITRKDLFTQTGNPIDPSQEVLASDTVHSQTSYVAGLAELRLPAFAASDVTFTAGYGLASLGQMMFGEIGLHYDVSSQAGIQCGLRVLRFTYDLNAEKSSVIGSGTSSLAISNAVAASNPSFNTELNAGLFFHF